MEIKKCLQCNLNNDDSVTACERCGYIFTTEVAPPAIDTGNSMGNSVKNQTYMPQDMTLEPTDESVFEEQPARKPQQPVKTSLFSCQHCGNAISYNAVLCPHCGVQYQELRVSRSGWSMSIAWGVILAGLLVWFISFLLTILFFILFVGGLASLSQPSRSPSTYSR